MKIEIANLWADELEGGRWLQATGRLKVVAIGGRAAHCCLGVLCEMAIRAGILISETQAQEGTCRAFDGDFELVPDSVKDWAGLGSRDPSYEDSFGDSIELSTANDKGTSFAEMAPIIRNNAADL